MTSEQKKAKQETRTGVHFVHMLNSREMLDSCNRFVLLHVSLERAGHFCQLIGHFSPKSWRNFLGEESLDDLEEVIANKKRRGGEVPLRLLQRKEQLDTKIAKLDEEANEPTPDFEVGRHRRYINSDDEDGGLDTHVVKHALLDVKKTSHLLVKFKICCAQINVGTTIYIYLC